MDEECVRQLALSVVKKAPTETASPTASSEEKLKTYSFVLRIRRAENLTKEVSLM